MGSCISAPSDTESATGLNTPAGRHAQAEKEMRQTKKLLDQQTKVLLLGSGDSGKTTVLKQMRVINNLPWSPTEIESYRQIVFVNIVQGGRMLLEAAEVVHGELSADNERRQELLPPSADIRQGEGFPRALLALLTDLWEDKQIQNGFQTCTELALPDNLPYFFKHLPRLFEANYLPTTQDIIHCRARTTGITETIFDLGKSPLTKASNHPGQIRMVDVGGQKSERRKWIHFFQDVTAILFLVSLSGYNQSLFEERESNQMQDAMALWDQISHSEWFTNTSLILFLNKNDIFAKKIKRWPLKDTYPDYEGKPDDAEAGRNYFKKRFVRLAMKPASNSPSQYNLASNGKAPPKRPPVQKDIASAAPQRSIYVRFTTATDTVLLKVVMQAVADIILRENFARAAII